MEPPYSDHAGGIVLADGLNRCFHASDYDEDEDMEKALLDLKNSEAETCGDFGWPLEYATAHAYRNIKEYGEDILNVLDEIRLSRTVCPETAAFAFCELDDAIFRHRLRMQNHVDLRWTDEKESPPGVTLAPHKRGISKICIVLSTLLYQHDSTKIDDLLEIIIHQMIHAWFLMCCGAQLDNEVEDGRLADGLHLGVLMYAINEIGKGCAGEPMQLAFCRVKSDGHSRYISSPYVHTSKEPGSSTYITVDSNGCLLGAPPSAGWSHCSLKNYRIPLKLIKDFSSHGYHKAWKTDYTDRATRLRIVESSYDKFTNHTTYALAAICRLHAPPSRQYFELVWDWLHFMIPKEKILALPSLKALAEASATGRDIEFMHCPTEVIYLAYEFIMEGHYWPNADNWQGEDGPTEWRGTATYIPDDDAPDHRQSRHVRVFITADYIGFEELRMYAYRRLMDMTNTREDPMKALEIAYLGEPSIQIFDEEYIPHHDLRYWARSFLEQHSHEYRTKACRNTPAEACNLFKIMRRYQTRFADLMNKGTYFKADFDDVYVQDLLHIH